MKEGQLDPFQLSLIHDDHHDENYSYIHIFEPLFKSNIILMRNKSPHSFNGIEYRGNNCVTFVKSE